MRSSESIRDECIHAAFVHLSSFLSMSYLRARLETNVLKRTRHVYLTENLERGSSWKEDEGPAIGRKEWKRGKQAGQIRESRKRGDCNLRRSLLQNETSDWRGRVFVRSARGKNIVDCTPFYWWAPLCDQKETRFLLRLFCTAVHLKKVLHSNILQTSFRILRLLHFDLISLYLTYIFVYFLTIVFFYFFRN